MKRKGTTIRGRSAKRKGSRAEIKVRNALRTIYPVEKRQNVQRVPLSGAGSMKGDVFDGNDYDSCYEVKCQETLVLHDWWRQAKAQAGTARTPILVITQAYRPFYYIMHQGDFLEMVGKTEYDGLGISHTSGNSRGLFDKLAEMGERDSYTLLLDDDLVDIINESFYLEIKKSLYINQY